MTETKDVRLPADLCAAVEKKFAGKFGSLEELLIFVLSELLRDEGAERDQKERKLVEDRLRDLGYL